MKTVGCILFALSLLTQTSLANDDVVDAVYKKYKSYPNATRVNLGAPLLKFAMHFDDDAKQLTIESVKVLTIEKQEGENINFYREIIENLQLSAYTEYIRVVEKDEQVLVIGKEEGDKITELLVVTGGDENTLVRIKGEIGREDVDSLIDL